MKFLVGATTKYAWESFIKDDKTLKEIITKYKAGDAKTAVNIILKNLPEKLGPDGVYTLADRINSASYLADWARIPANQVWMMKSKFSIGSRNFREKLPRIVAPYWPQTNLVVNVPPKNTSLNYKNSIFEPWDDQTYPGLAKTRIAFDVLINWFMNMGYFEDNGTIIARPTQRQAEVRAREEFELLFNYYRNNDDTILRQFLSFDNRGLS